MSTNPVVHVFCFNSFYTDTTVVVKYFSSLPPAQHFHIQNKMDGDYSNGSSVIEAFCASCSSHCDA